MKKVFMDDNELLKFRLTMLIGLFFMGMLITLVGKYLMQ